MKTSLTFLDIKTSWYTSAMVTGLPCFQNEIMNNAAGYPDNGS